MIETGKFNTERFEYRYRGNSSNPFMVRANRETGYQARTKLWVEFFDRHSTTIGAVADSPSLGGHLTREQTAALRDVLNAVLEDWPK